MPLSVKPYESEVTLFLKELKAKKPSLEEEQRKGRALLWDKELDRDALQRYGEASVPMPPYVYQTKG